MYVGYGDPSDPDFYQHDIGGASITFSVRTLFSRWRGFRHAREYRMTVQGELLCTHPTKTISQQIDEFITAYSVNGKTLALYQDNGTVTQHKLDASDTATLDGPKINMRAWPNGDRGEYASHRTYFIDAVWLQSSYNSEDSWPGILRYQETLRYEGNGLASFWLVPDQNGNYWQRIRWPGTSLMMIQSGVSIGQGGYAEPLPPVYPLGLHNDKVQVVRESPTFGLGIGHGNAMEYQMRWIYPMEVTSSLFDVYTPVSR